VCSPSAEVRQRVPRAAAVVLLGWVEVDPDLQFVLTRLGVVRLTLRASTRLRSRPLDAQEHGAPVLPLAPRQDADTKRSPPAATRPPHRRSRRRRRAILLLAAGLTLVVFGYGVFQYVSLIAGIKRSDILGRRAGGPLR